MKRALPLLVSVLFIVVIFGSFSVHEVEAASLGNVKDIITTSRPSAASPINAAAPVGSGSITIHNNGSRYLASDSATIIRTAGGVATNIGMNVSSQSADLTRVYLGTVTTEIGGIGSDTLIVPITARHTISFNVITTIPSSGTIVISFPGAGSNAASPSATTFAFNNLSSGNISSSPAGACNGISVVAPNIICTTNTTITGGTPVTITLGSTTPALINPTKSAVEGTADSWKISLRTTDGVNDLDTGSAKIATIESVQVQGTVEPTLTFTIAGVNTATNINTLGGCTGDITTNSGINSTPTSVNLGILSNGYTSKAAQSLTVSTNAATGYVITATSSGRLTNPASGQFILDANGGAGLTANDTPVPAIITSGAAAFGIHACGARSSVNTDQWVVAGTMPDTGAGTARFSNPWNTGTNAFYNTIASYSGGPVTNDITAVLYAATVNGDTPAGIYSTNLTYVASATF